MRLFGGLAIIPPCMSHMYLVSSSHLLKSAALLSLVMTSVLFLQVFNILRVVSPWARAAPSSSAKELVSLSSSRQPPLAHYTTPGYASHAFILALFPSLSQPACNIVMPSPRTPPRIRIDLLGSSHGLSPSFTLDIRGVLDQARGLPELLAENSRTIFNDTDDLYSEDGLLQDAPTFPDGHQPPRFIVNSHRAQLPFPIRPEALELGDICSDEEDAPLVLTAPTIPRMNLMIKEHLYVQKWIDTLTLDDPPKHIPWTCDKPVPDRKWVSEGSIFPADIMRSFTEQRRNAREGTEPVIPSKTQARDKEMLCTRDLRMFREASVVLRDATGTHRWTAHMPVKSADLGLDTPRAEVENADVGPSENLRDILGSPQIPIPSIPVRTVPLIETPSNVPDVPLAARRGKALSCLQLKDNLIEELEYPDIPTAFRGSPSVWSPQFDIRLPDQPFTDHPSMLANLRLKCAALASGLSAPLQSSEKGCQWPQSGVTPETPHTSLNSDEWGFTQQLASFENGFMGPFNESAQVSLSFRGQIGEITADASLLPPDECPRPTKGSGSNTKSERRFQPHSSTPAMECPVSNLSSPPEVPLPPRPALVNPATPPHVRGILKKAKSVRFEDAIIKEPEDQAPSPVPPAPEVTPKRPSPLRQSFTAASERPLTPIPNRVKTSTIPAKVIAVEVKPPSERNVPEKKSVPRPRLAPKGPIFLGKANRLSGLPALRPKDVNAQGTDRSFKPPSATSWVERPCQTACANKENAGSTAVPQAQRKQRWSTTTEANVSRGGLEGTPKSRLSTPLRNIFRFR
ncbi:hypothetical protein BS17DRAFT_470138 [Gyrodon lividus]|nr:hypothetical protein BS17DRAFT_470138 [Gyrodon lividus]